MRIIYFILVAMIITILLNATACSSEQPSGGADAEPDSGAIIVDDDAETNGDTDSEVAERRIFSSLVLTDVSVLNGKVVITGSTDLPNGATLSVGIDVWGRSGADLYIGVSERPTVSEGSFSVELTPPQREEFAEGPYEISVLFTPRNQSDEVLELVGYDGENLSGDLVDQIGTFNTMKLVEQEDLELSITPPSYTFQQPTEFERGTAERALAEYVSAWKDQDWRRMTRFTQKTWLSSQEDPVDLLEAWYDFKTLLGFEIVSVNNVTNVTADVTFIVQYEAFTNKISKKRIIARVIRESTAYTTSERGDWGVNPTSTLREEDFD